MSKIVIIIDDLESGRVNVVSRPTRKQLAEVCARIGPGRATPADVYALAALNAIWEMNKKAQDAQRAEEISIPRAELESLRRQAPIEDPDHQLGIVDQESGPIELGDDDT